MFRRLVLGVACLIALASMMWAREVKLARHPDYHNGKIVFSYLGDIWLADESGKSPVRLTVHKARDVYPRFSPDGKWVAFSSDRDGNYDVYIIPVEGGAPKQLTFNTAADIVVGWTRDSKNVIFNSIRGGDKVVFPGTSSLWQVSIEGGLEQRLDTDWGYWGSYSPDGNKLAFNRHPMVWWRKHYRGSYAADLWVMDVKNKTFKQILDANTPDNEKPSNFWPMFGNNGEIYFVSDREVTAKAGTREVYRSANNIWKISEEGGKPVQVTHHKDGSLFWPSMSSDGRVIVYEDDNQLWKLDVASGKSTAIRIDINSDDKENNEETLTINNEADGYDLSPSTKRAVISTHGELFSIPTDRGNTIRITESFSREVRPQWSPDAKWIAFVSDKSGREEVWLCKPDVDAKDWKQVSNSDSEKLTIVWAPDSKALVYTASDHHLYKYTLETGKTDVLASSPVSGFGGAAIGNPQFSPDSKWISFTRISNTLLPHVVVISSAGGAEHRITDNDVYSDANAVWSPDGQRLVYISGMDSGNIGGGETAQAQLYSVVLMSEEKNPFDRGIDDEEAAAAAEAASRPMGMRRPGGGEGMGAGSSRVEVKIDWEGIGRRSHQITHLSENVSSVAISHDSRTYAFVATTTIDERPSSSIYTIQEDGERLTKLTQSGGRREGQEQPPAGGFGMMGFSSLQFSKDGRTLFYREGRSIYSIAVSGGAEGAAAAPSSPAGSSSGGTRTGRRINFVAKVDVDHRLERQQVFNESWRVMKFRFYDPQMNGVDWNRMKQMYEPLIAYTADQEEMHNVILEMIGELNASHTGISAGAGARPEIQTRYPGFEIAADPSGFYTVTWVYKDGPADHDYVKIKAGDFILAIDDHPLKSGDNYFKYYNAAAGRKFELRVNSKPSVEGAWKTTVEPVNAQAYGTLQYQKWVADRRAMVDEWSHGEVGYLHIRQMNAESLRKFGRDLSELHFKKGLVVDQRFNPGGGIDQELLEILGQRQYQYTRGRDSINVTRPLRAFFGPVVVMENERSTSDAEVFPDGIRTLKLGTVVGVTTYGAVIGTGAYTLLDGSSVRTPGTGLWNVNGTNLENYGVPPDVYVDNTPGDYLKGNDAQLKKAVEVLQAQLKTKK
ncbi:MAG: S41 family peptidase [Acidobacteriia bacterium]|nr:S41 family peptidase [Terriglobia bacterium]